MHMERLRLKLLAPLALAALALSGCGGSGSSPGGGGAGGTASAQIFAQDDMNAGFDHVWVTINSVALTTATGTSTTVFDATAAGGRVVDLRTLHDASGAKFLLLGGFDAPNGSYTGVTVTVASTLTVFPAGATTGTIASFAGATGNNYKLQLTFPTAQSLSASNHIVVDFNLANWTLNGQFVSAPGNAFLSLGTTTGLGDGNRHLPSDYDGTVGGITGTSPSQTFTLTDGKSTMTVSTSAATTVVNSDGSANAALANGEAVDVTGTFDTTNNVLNATSITIRIASSPPPQRVHGLVTAFDATAQTVTVQLEDCDRFEPSSSTVTVDVGASTIYFGSSGVTDNEAQFFAALVAGTSRVYADGSLSGSTLTAVHIGVDNPPTPPTTIDVAVRGPVSNAAATAGTFDLQMKDWEGGDRSSSSATVHVVTTGATVFRLNGSASSAAAFFAALTPTTNAQVRGSLDPTSKTLTATLVSVGSDDWFHF